MIFKTITKWAATWQNQQNECAPSEDSDEPGHPPSLIRVFSVRMKKAWVLNYPLSAQRRLWSDWADAQADLSLRWAHSHFVGFVMSRLRSLSSRCLFERIKLSSPLRKHWQRADFWCVLISLFLVVSSSLSFLCNDKNNKIFFKKHSNLSLSAAISEIMSCFSKKLFY